MTERRRATSTSNFGVSRRESHDAAGFYARFTAPEVSKEQELGVLPELSGPWLLGDARRMTLADGSVVPDNCVALVVTSPPYFAGKQYEEELDKDGVPSSYAEYLQLLTDVFAECKRVLEPGGRIAVNVANLGRKPYRSLSADVIAILQDELGLLLRGEVIWQKADGAAGNCAWGSFKSASNPVLRDITERVIVASKGRFDRARSVEQRRQENRPHQSTLNNDEFLEATLDVWRLPAESAKRVKHPAPFPVELPERLIRLYTFKDDVILDPFMGSGTTLVAAASLGRRFFGFDTDPEYVDVARQRVSDELTKRRDDDPAKPRSEPLSDEDIKVLLAKEPVEDFQARASKEGKAAQSIAESVLERAGFTIKERNHRIRSLGLVVNFLAEDDAGVEWYFDVSGAFSTARGGLLRTDTVWKSLGRAHVLGQNGLGPVVFLTSHLPKRRSEGDAALRAAGPRAFFDAMGMLSVDGQERLAQYAAGGHHERPLEGFWTGQDLDKRNA